MIVLTSVILVDFSCLFREAVHLLVDFFDQLFSSVASSAGCERRLELLGRQDSRKLSARIYLGVS